MEERVRSNTEKIAVLETRVTALETRVAVAENNIDTINRKLDKIEANTSKLLWIVVTFVIMAVLGYVFNPKVQQVKAAAFQFIGGVYNG